MAEYIYRAYPEHSIIERLTVLETVPGGWVTLVMGDEHDTPTDSNVFDSVEGAQDYIRKYFEREIDRLSVLQRRQVALCELPASDE